MARQASALVELGVTFDEILTSPLVRARQTADILADAYAGRPRIVELPALEPGRRPKDVLTALGNFTKRGSLALVGHEPGMGELAAALLGLRTPPAFKKGGVALIDVALLPPPAGSGELVWFVPPRLLRAVGRKK
jgi:phosphohistidine phosphatase